VKFAHCSVLKNNERCDVLVDTGRHFFVIKVDGRVPEVFKLVLPALQILREDNRVIVIIVAFFLLFIFQLIVNKHQLSNLELLVMYECDKWLKDISLTSEANIDLLNSSLLDFFSQPKSV
jgi:hypothetical protein